MNLSKARQLARTIGVAVALDRDRMRWRIGLPCLASAEFDIVAFGQLTERQFADVCKTVKSNKIAFV